jgi:carboxymethylenebutenolidase
MNHDMRAETVQIEGHGSDLIEAYLARPTDKPSFGSVVVIHHLPGYDDTSKAYARRFADHGYAAIVPNLYSREAPGADPSDAAALVRSRGGVPDERLVGDVDGAARALRALDGANGKVGVIGYCSGGRQSFLAACSLKLDAAVDCYGAYVVNAPAADSPLKMRPIVALAANLSCPLLGLFGAEDKAPTPDEVAQLDNALTEQGLPHEFHTFEGAGHAFFASDRPSYRVEAANEGWRLIFDFYGRLLAG